MEEKKMERREFIKKTAQAAAAATLMGSVAAEGVTGQSGKTAESTSLPKRVLGKTGLELPILGYGGAALPKEWGNPASTADRVALVRYAFDRGIRYFDTAGNYYDSEAILGDGLKGIRDQVCLVTKVETTEPGEVRKSVESSLKNLQTDYIDVILIHGTPGLQQMSVDRAMQIHDKLLGLQKNGRVRFLGFSAHSYFDKALALIESGGFDMCMLALGYIPRGYDQVFSGRMIELRNACVARAHETGMGLVAMKVIGAGMLGAYSGFVVPGFDEARLRDLPTAAISHVLSDKRIDLLAIGMRLREEIDANIAYMSGDTAYTLQHKALLADFALEAYESPAIKAMRID